MSRENLARGRRVRITYTPEVLKNPWLSKGRVGRYAGKVPDTDNAYAIEFARKCKGDTCHGLVPSGHGWVLQRHEFELVTGPDPVLENKRKRERKAELRRIQFEQEKLFSREVPVTKPPSKGGRPRILPEGVTRNTMKDYIRRKLQEVHAERSAREINSEEKTT